VLTQNQTKPDNVCIDAYDIDGDGQLDLALGAEWRPSNTREGGTIQWLRRGQTLDDPWTVHPIDTEPSVHRMRFADLNQDGRAELIVGPLLGRNSTREKNWSDAPVRVLAYQIPKEPLRERWVPEVIDHHLHVMHNFWPADVDEDGKLDLLTASYEGVCLLTRTPAGPWLRRHLGAGNQSKPHSNRGASEIKLGKLKNGQKYIATIEPWHGDQVVVYTPPTEQGQMLWNRHVIDEQLKWGHAVSCADLDGDGDEELIIGVRDALNAEVRGGVNIFKAVDGTASKWIKHVVDNGGVACEDLATADLNNDGKIDIVAVGRATGNVRIYWNQGLK
jgi:hypothetical protein